MRNRRAPAGLVAAALLLACAIREPEGRITAAALGAPGSDRVALRFAGCYEVTSRDLAYRLALDTLRDGPARAARLLDPPEATGQGSWSWAPVGSDGFAITWLGIDSGLRFDVQARAGRLVAAQRTWWVPGPQETTQPAEIQPIACDAGRA